MQSHRAIETAPAPWWDDVFRRRPLRGPPLDLGPDFPMWGSDFQGMEVERRLPHNDADRRSQIQRCLLREQALRAFTEDNPLVFHSEQMSMGWHPCKGENANSLARDFESDREGELQNTDAPLWLEIWGPWIANHEVRLPIPPALAACAQQARDLQIVAGTPGQIPGWIVEEVESYYYGGLYYVKDGVAMQGPKVDNRWLQELPAVRRYPALVEKLKLLAESSFLEVFWRPPMVDVEFDDLVHTEVIRVALFQAGHCRSQMVIGSNSLRAAYCKGHWDGNAILMPACPWCCHPATMTCCGVPSHACRVRVCCECARTFSRCVDCTMWIGLPPRFVFKSWEESHFQPVVGCSRDWVESHFQPVVGAEWTDVWDGVSALREFVF